MTERVGQPADADSETTTVAFVCIQNAGRSQMAAAFAERARRRRGLESQITVRSGGTDPAKHVHDVVVDAMDEVGIDVSERRPREITPEEIETCDIVITMGCDAEGICPMTWRGDARDWALEDPHGSSVEDVRKIRVEIERRVEALFKELTTAE